MAGMTCSPVLFTIPETAGRLGVSVRTVYALISDGELNVVDVARKGSRSKSRIRDDDLADFIDKRTRRAPR